MVYLFNHNLSQENLNWMKVTLDPEELEEKEVELRMKKLQFLES